MVDSENQAAADFLTALGAERRGCTESETGVLEWMRVACSAHVPLLIWISVFLTRHLLDPAHQSFCLSALQLAVHPLDEGCHGSRSFWVPFDLGSLGEVAKLHGCRNAVSQAHDAKRLLQAVISR